MNQLFYGENLEVLRKDIRDESVDLIYLDPPFNSKRDYNLLFKTPKGVQSAAQITALRTHGTGESRLSESSMKFFTNQTLTLQNSCEPSEASSVRMMLWLT